MDTLTSFKVPTLEHESLGGTREESLLNVRRALISVSDKRGIVDLAKGLRRFGVELISTGGTHQALKDAGVEVKSVSDVTGFPEILDGRVKTLHPAIHAGILAAADNPLHLKQLAQHHIKPIDLVVVNLYPFEQTIAGENVTIDQAIEQIDIGGPAMVRAAAKNYRHTVVMVNPDRYASLLEELTKNSGSVSSHTRFELAREAFQHTATYDTIVASYFTGLQSSRSLPDVVTVSMKKNTALRYGENPHQAAALYGKFDTYFKKLHGKELSYNNILDINAAVLLSAEFEKPTAVIVKHNNPCGVGSGETLLDAYKKAFVTDQKSAFGGIVAVNRVLDMSTAEAVNDIFTEVVIAPDFGDGVLDFLMKKRDRRLIQQLIDVRSARTFDIRGVIEGLLVQEQDQHRITREGLRTVTNRKPTEEEFEALIFAWRVAKHVKSNAIVYARKDRTLGIGAGQMSRVDSAKIAVLKAADAGLSLAGCAVASDAFFPFADGLLEAVKGGATCVIQPGGSVRDEEVIKAADEHNVAMAFTAIRHFRH
ncbi:MAG: bifunctional phosphoribosylaminoimidazolecarboxamide formyltransferase/IMP cyclohydrolase [Ignavibacteriales bacterium]|nr:bifunctional phosphoribosylaminoimidazolecarboxamide formyltransferase/IMP cyclohydrolase [Ignavibacteriales bacterium]